MALFAAILLRLLLTATVTADAAQLGVTVSQDLWIPGASQPGEEQHVEAVVSEMFVLKQLKAAIQLRETWLEQNGLPMNCQMRDKVERKAFLEWAKDLYHPEPFQQQRQAADFLAGGKKKVKDGKTSRWSRELQRRLGTPQLWYMVTFTGRFDRQFLQAGDDSSQIVALTQESQWRDTQLARADLGRGTGCWHIARCRQ